MSQTDTLFSAQSKTIFIAGTSTASASTALPAAGNTVRMMNEGPNVAYVSIGPGAQTATVPTGTAAATCTPVGIGADVTMSIPNDSIQNISIICRGTGTAIFNVQVGEGS